MIRFLTVRSNFSRGVLAAVAAMGLVLAGMADANARGGKGGSIGSRGSKTYQAPPSTNTTPGQTQGIQRSMTQPGAAVAGAATSATAAATQAAKGSMVRNLLLGGLIGAGLASVFGTGALANVLGFLLQGLLIAGIVMLGIALFRRMSGATPAPATAAAVSGQAARRPDQNLQRTAMGGLGGSAPALQLVDADFDAFQRLLTEVQGAYGANDIDALGKRVTPEMLSYFAAELDDNRKQGLRNELGPVTLLQGDLSEAWREAGSEYATVAMRYSLTDATVDRNGNVVSGDRNRPQEVTEVWTFRRDPNAGPSGWELSAIQQTA